MNNLETTLEHAQKITLGQVDNGTLATAVTCADTLQIVRHGLVESYVIPKHLIDDLLLKVAVLECDNKRLLGERVTNPNCPYCTNHDCDAVHCLYDNTTKTNTDKRPRLIQDIDMMKKQRLSLTRAGKIQRRV